MAIQFDGQSIESGTREWVELPVTTEVTGDSLGVPTCIVHGGEGPTVWLQGGTHGGEQVTSMALRDVLVDLDPAAVSGTVIGVPIANVTAFTAKRRTSPLDNEDLNRKFPGTDAGSFTQGLAHTLYQVAAEHADFAVDLHNGGNPLYSPGFVIFVRADDAIERTARELCTVTGLPIAVGIGPDTLAGSLTSALVADGIPCILTETGGEGRLHSRDYDSATTLIRNLLGHLGLTDQAPSIDPTCSFHEGLTILKARNGGFFQASVEGNQPVDEGDRLGYISNVKGGVTETFEAPFDAVVVGRRTYGNASPGDWVFELTQA